MNEKDLAFNNLPGLICHKTKPNKIIVWFQVFLSKANNYMVIMNNNFYLIKVICFHIVIVLSY